MATKPKKRRIKSTADLDLLKMYGTVPSYSGNPDKDPNYNIILAHALNWCSRGIEPKDAKKELIFWMQKHKYGKNDTKAISFIDENFLGSIGSIAFLDNNGFSLTSSMIENLKLKLSEHIEVGSKLRNEKEAEAAIKKKTEELKKLSISAEAKNITDAYTIFDFVEDSLFSDYKIDTERLSIIAKEYKATVLIKAISRINDLKEELELISTDKEVAEAYSHIKKRDVQKIIKGFEQSVETLDIVKMNKAVSRKPRVSKPKSAAQQVDNLKYLKKDDKLSAVSIDPRLIVGAVKLIVYNVKTRKLGIYTAKTDAGFMVKGTTILNFDEKTSKQKTIRELKNATIKDTVTSFRKSPKLKSSTMFDQIKTLETSLTGRLNTDILLLKAFK